MFIGEQPGDQEDLQGAPFVGPAGEVFDKALLEAGLEREKVYVTNAVKHFKFEQRGKRRIHQTPRATELNACRPWLEAELCRDQTGRARLPRRDGGPRDLWRQVQDHEGPWPLRSDTLGAEDDRDLTIPRPCSAARARRSRLKLYAMLLEDLRKVARA